MPTPTHKTIALSSINVQVAEWGREGKPPLILLHGLASTHHMFDLIAPALAQDWHVYTFDQRGHGLSDKPNTGYDFEQIASDIDELIDVLDIEQPLRMLGHSWGGYTALYYAATRPEKIAKAVLLDGGTLRFRDRFQDWEQANIAMSPPRYHNQNLDHIKHMIRESWLGEAFRPEIEPLALSIFDLSNPDDVRARLNRENHMQIARSIWAFEPGDYYPKIQCPLLIVYAQSDDPNDYARQQTSAQRAKDGVSDVEIVWMPNTIHDIPWHKPDELVRVLVSFLV